MNFQKLQKIQENNSQELFCKKIGCVGHCSTLFESEYVKIRFVSISQSRLPNELVKNWHAQYFLVKCHLTD
jgi:hypothetical protein